ncbi:hypothetical protein [Roseovarius salis]|uniref:hypothetical protein n=1 Tax=Roseovarius salis TaxID=3376063 RepID=UPI0037C900D7
MTATRILHGLERSAAKGDEADGIARLWFLEWVFGLDGEATPAEARAALASRAAQNAESAAACAFVRFLRQAAQPVAPEMRRRRRRAIH